MTEFDATKIAVIIPAYNCEATIERAIDSVLSQRVREEVTIECIVVDDCSTDGTAMRVKKKGLSSPNLTCLTMPANGGPSAARNLALSSTDAAWFTPLDSDDFMEDDRLEALYAYAATNQLSLVADNLNLSYDAAPTTKLRLLWPDKPQGPVDLTLDLFVKQNLSSSGSRCELGYIKPLIDRSELETAKAPYRGEMRFGEDYDLYCRVLASGGRAVLLDDLGYFSVQREGSLSRTPRAGDFEKLARTDLSLLMREDLSQPQRRLIKQHLKETQKEWAWVRAIEAVRGRNPFQFLGAFFISAPASLSLFSKLVGHFSPGRANSKTIEAA